MSTVFPHRNLQDSLGLRTIAEETCLFSGLTCAGLRIVGELMANPIQPHREDAELFIGRM